MDLNRAIEWLMVGLLVVFLVDLCYLSYLLLTNGLH